jgi:hypothetical protein
MLASLHRRAYSQMTMRTANHFFFWFYFADSSPKAVE